jgi:hypothetical protein
MLIGINPLTHNMRKASLLLTAIAGLAIFAIAYPSFAAESGKGKERTITGEAKCAKCALKQGDKCQTVIQVENKKGKTVTYYLAENDVSKEFHSKVCKETKKVTATGTVKKVDGKTEFTVSKIDLAK